MNQTAPLNRPATSGSSSVSGNLLIGTGTEGVKVLRGRPMNVKVKKKCCSFENLCQPIIIFLLMTLIMTGVASGLLTLALTSRYWEMMIYDPGKLNALLAENNTRVSVHWLFDGKVPRINFIDKHPTSLLYLLPIHSGVWISCLDLTEQEYQELKLTGYDKVRCIDHLNPEFPKPTEARASWQHRMQNLAIACALVCLILLGTAVFIGLFGLLRRQISAVLVTGVIYVLATTFSLFTLTIVHLKHKNRQDLDPLDVWTRLTPNHVEFRAARLIFHGWSLSLAWAGSFVCLLASVMWILLSKMMRYNPISIST